MECTWKEFATEVGASSKGSSKSASYDEMASLAATIPIPSAVLTKDACDFKIIGTSTKNAEAVFQKPSDALPTFAARK